MADATGSRRMLDRTTGGALDANPHEGVRETGLECSTPGCHAAAEWRAGRSGLYRACDLHRAVEEADAEQLGIVGLNWRRIDGNAVALVLVFVGFLLLPGCGESDGDPWPTFVGLTVLAFFLGAFSLGVLVGTVWGPRSGIVERKE